MTSLLDNIVVVLAVGSSAAWLLRRSLAPKRKACAASCGSGCEAPRPQQLVQIGRKAS